MSDGGDGGDGGDVPLHTLPEFDQGWYFCTLVLRCLSRMDEELQCMWASAYELVAARDRNVLDKDESAWYQASVGRHRLYLKRMVGALLRDNVDLQQLWKDTGAKAFHREGEVAADIQAFRNFRGCFHGGPFYRVFLHAKTRDAVDGFSTRDAYKNFRLAEERQWKSFLKDHKFREVNLVNPSGRHGFLTAWLELKRTDKQPEAAAVHVAQTIRDVALFSCAIQKEEEGDDRSRRKDSMEAQLVVWTAAFLARFWLDALVDVWNSARTLFARYRVPLPISEVVGDVRAQNALARLKARASVDLTEGAEEVKKENVSAKHPGVDGLASTASGRTAAAAVRPGGQPTAIRFEEPASKYEIMFFKGVNAAMSDYAEVGAEAEDPELVLSILDRTEDVDKYDSVAHLDDRSPATYRSVEAPELAGLKLSTKKRAALLRAKFILDHLPE
jgi:hypothetical protein